MEWRVKVLVGLLVIYGTVVVLAAIYVGGCYYIDWRRKRGKEKDKGLMGYDKDTKGVT